LTALDAAVRATLARLDAQRFVERLWAKDASLWKAEPDHQRVIKNSLGWLAAPRRMLAGLGELLAFADEVRKAGYTHAVVLGMGGSSLCPDVCRATFGTAPGYLHLHVLDSTVPACVAKVEADIDLPKTLFLVSSKSGGTVEPMSFYKHFYECVRQVKGERAGENFVAITDPNTSLEKLAHERRFRRIFPGQPDIGGRYSALSNFGVVPAALAGVDVRTLLGRASEMAEACSLKVPLEDNPGVALGALLAEAARVGRDKITIVMSAGIYTFGDWVEQLIAESVGKEGKGLLPVIREYVGEPAAYRNDRLFVHVTLAGETKRIARTRLKALEAAGHPVVQIQLADKYELGKEFFRWEVATATAGALLGINPFDQPNVQESKDNTHRLLAEFRAQGRLPEDQALAEFEGVKFYGGYSQPPGGRASRQGQPPASGAECLAAFLSQAKPGDYLALLPYLEPTSAHKAALQVFRLHLRDGLRLATTIGYGPRYLHSTGQLHKGGPANGLFILITADDRRDLAVPGEPYSFAVLKQAQALGDFQALRSKGRPVIRLHLGRQVQTGLDHIATFVKKALADLGRVHT
jgi:glucose-6-phosphate isomerase